MEKRFSKDEILDALPGAGALWPATIEGMRAASLAYFGKEAEAADASPKQPFSSALPQSPEARRPDRDATAARAAATASSTGWEPAAVTADETAEAAKHESVPDAARTFPMLAAHLGQELPLKAQPDEPVIKLTVDRELQESPLRRSPRERMRARGPKLSVAMVVADHLTGEILASVGLRPGFRRGARDGFVDMTQALRSPGSTLKPFIYGLAFEPGLALSGKPDRGTGRRRFPAMRRPISTLRAEWAVAPAGGAALKRSGRSRSCRTSQRRDIAVRLGGVGISPFAT